VSKREHYREILRSLSSLSDWESFLLNESGLPGPRANLELAQAAADERNEELFRRLGLSMEGAAGNEVRQPSQILTRLDKRLPRVVESFQASKG